MVWRNGIAILWIIGVVGVACRCSKPAPNDPGVPRRAGSDALAVDALAVDAPPDAPAIDAQLPPVVLPDDAIVVALLREAGDEPALLEEHPGELIATTPSGRRLRVLAKGPVRRADYGFGQWLLWFHRGEQLRVIDLASSAMREIAVVDGMVDLPLAYAVAPPQKQACHMGCVALGLSPSPTVAAVAPTLDAGLVGGVEEAREVETAQRTAARARPQLTAEGRAFLAEFAARRTLILPRRPADVVYRVVEISPDVWPVPPSIRKGSSCMGVRCGHSFSIPTLARSLVVTGRTCKCQLGGCWAMCVWFDPARKLYASLRNPGRWLRDVAAEPNCHPAFDTSGAAYVIGGHKVVSPGPAVVCNAKACRPIGRFLGWLESGEFTTENVTEDLSICPH